MTLNNNFYKDIIFNAPCGYIFLEATYDETHQSATYTFLDANPYFCELTKLKKEKIIGKTFKEIILVLKWDDLFIDSFFMEVLNTGKTKSIKRYFRHLNKWYHIIVSSPEENRLTLVFMLLENNEVQEYEYKISPRQNFFQILMDTITDFVSFRDINGRYVECNNAIAKNIYGLPKEQIIGKTFFELIEDKEEAKQLFLQDNEVIQTNEAKIFEFPLMFIDKSIHILETIKVPFYDDNKIVGIISISRDVTSRTYYEEKLRESEERFRQLAENIDEAFWLATDEEMLYISPGYERIWERSIEDVYKDLSNFRKYIYEEDKQRIFKALESEEYSVGCNFNEKYRIVKPDGTIRWVWEKIFSIRNNENEIIRRAGIIEDITTLKVAEEVVARTKEEIMKVELQKKSMELQQLSELESLRTDFFANLSHELRTPINLILSSIKMMEIYNDDTNIEEVIAPIKYLKIIKQNSYRLMRLINNLIDVTKIDAGFLKLKAYDCDIVDIVKKITLSVADYAKTKNISLIFETEIDNLVLKCDPDKIERIMLNLLSNAVKFNVPKGNIKVSVSTFKDELYICVSDTGIGIPEEKLQMIFERFKQVESRLTKEGEGSGIGLSLVKAFVEMHGGSISVSSAVGSGTQFLVKLPIQSYSEESTCMDLDKEVNDDSRVERIRMEFSDIYGIKF